MKKKVLSVMLASLILFGVTALFTVDVEAAGVETKDDSFTTVSVRIGGNIAGYTGRFQVPTGKTLTIDYEFVNDENGNPLGYQMRINGNVPDYNTGAGISWKGGSVVDGITVGSTASALPTEMVTFNTAKPNGSYTFTATEETAGQAINAAFPTIPVSEAVGGESNLMYDIVYVNHDTNEVVGRYSVDRIVGKKGDGCKAKAIYGTWEENFESGQSLARNLITQSEKMKGYAPYRGKVGAPDIQKYTYIIGEDGVHIISKDKMYQGNDKEVIYYVEIKR